VKRSRKLTDIRFEVRGPITEEAARMEREGRAVLKLNIGNPAEFGFAAPEEFIAQISARMAGAQGYSDARGLPEARAAVAAYARSKGIAASEDDVFIGNGVSELIQMSMNALLDDGDEVLLPAPDYPVWTSWVTLSGGRAVHYICDEQADWCPDIADIRRKITAKTRAIVLINPNNPTGALYPREALEEIAGIAREHGLMIFSDEIYDRSVMDGEEHVSAAAAAPDVFCATFGGLSKSHMLCGFRSAWMILSGPEPEGDYRDGLTLLANLRISPNVPGQLAIEPALGDFGGANPYVMPGSRLYEQRKFIVGALNAIPGISVVQPKAAFYLFPKIDTAKFGVKDDGRFVLDFLKEKGVLLVPGSGFNWPRPDHVRIVYLAGLPWLREAAEKLEEFLGGYRQS